MSATHTHLMTPREFLDQVLATALLCGYDVDEKPMHPEDIANSLVPVMTAYASGYTDALLRVKVLRSKGQA